MKENQWIEKFLKKENMIVFVLLGILLLVIAIPVGEDKTSEDEEEKSADVAMERSGESEFTDTNLEYCLQLEKRIEDILTCMDGVGEVEAMVTLVASKELVVEKDEPVTRSTVTEKDGTGGSRSTNESRFEYETIYETDKEGNKIPYVIKSMEPKIQGITVVAQGGGNPLVQKNISEVLEALFHVEVHKIKVVKMK